MDDYAVNVANSLYTNISAIVAPQDATPHSAQNGECVPQRRYKKGAGRDPLDNRGLAMFVRQDGSYIPVLAAMSGDFNGLVNCDIPALDGTDFTIVLRLAWPGYPLQDFQLRTYDWCKPPKRITLSKLAMEVAKVIQCFIERIQGQAIAPEYAMWRVGPNGIQAKDLRLAALERVSAGSWQPRLFYRPQFELTHGGMRPHYPEVASVAHSRGRQRA